MKPNLAAFAAAATGNGSKFSILSHSKFHCICSKEAWENFVIRDIDKIAATLADGRWKNKVAWIGPTINAFGLFVVPDEERLPDRMHQRCDRARLPRPTIAGSQVHGNGAMELHSI